jgi:hypothetical protein
MKMRLLDWGNTCGVSKFDFIFFLKKKRAFAMLITRLTNEGQPTTPYFFFPADVDRELVAGIRFGFD